jgi:K+-sensing histidine kinase KdpD
VREEPGIGDEAVIVSGPMAPEAPQSHAGVDTAGLTIGVVVGIPAAVAAGAIMAAFRPLFDGANAALVLMIVVVAVAALGGRAAGIVTALAAVLSFDFFHTEPYLSLTIDSRDDVETTLLLLVAGVLVGTIASAGRSARRRAGSARSEVLRIHRVAEAAVSGRDAADVIAIAQEELRDLLQLRECRFEALPARHDVTYPRIGRSGVVEGQTVRRYGRDAGGRGGFELPAAGVELSVLARGQHIGRFVLVPTPGVALSLEQRVVAVAIADQVAAVWIPTEKERSR